MDIPLSRYPNRSLISKVILRQRCLFSGCFLLGKRKRRSLISRISCSVVEQVLYSKPKLKPIKIDHELVMKETHVKKSQEKAGFSSEICDQIENFVSCRRYEDALDIFETLDIEGGHVFGKSTYYALVDACVKLKSFRGIRKVLNHMIKSKFEPDLSMWNSILFTHVRCRKMTDAQALFDKMPERDLSSWNTIIAGLVDSRNYALAFRLFLIMWEQLSEANSHTFVTMVRASAGLELISHGQQFHSCALKMGLGEDVFVSCALINMYSKCGSIEDAQCVFDMMPEKTTVGWNSIIAGYVRNKYYEEALYLYYEMQDLGHEIDHFTFSILVTVCTKLGLLEHVKQVHAGLVRHGFGLDIVANSALVDFYGKWGRIEDARNVFDQMPRKDVISWSALISGYGSHGRGTDAVKLFERMISQGVRPNHVTFLAVLSACSYSGLSDQGWVIFKSMGEEFAVEPGPKHYSCMIELLCKEGQLDKALVFIRRAPFRPTLNMWVALLTACRVDRDFELGKFAAEKIYGMEPHKLINYVVLLNIYKTCGMRDEAAIVYHALRKKGLRISRARTWIDVKREQRVFISGDNSHVQTKEIYENLNKLMSEISKHGYVPRNSTTLPDVDEREGHMPLHHSEKLAVSFGLINYSSNSKPLRLLQSHRICEDCHIAMKLIAKTSRRVIIVKDASRFHRFQDGKCTCGDYW